MESTDQLTNSERRNERRRDRYHTNPQYRAEQIRRAKEYYTKHRAAILSKQSALEFRLKRSEYRRKRQEATA